nr:DUF2975 domain-containing protein [uncultured Cohaesibacter sp.]
MYVLSDHQITSFHIFKQEYENPPASTLNALAFDTAELSEPRDQQFDRSKPSSVKCWVPPKLRPGLLIGKLQHKPIWQEDQPSFGESFHMPVRNLLNGEQKDRCRVWRLSNDTLDWFRKGRIYPENTPIEEKREYSLAIPISDRGRQRLKNEMPEEQDFPPELIFVDGANEKSTLYIPILLTNGLLFHFATGRVICQLSIQIKKIKGLEITDTLLTEVNDVVSRFAKLDWIEKPLGNNAKDNPQLQSHILENATFTLGQLAARLLLGSTAETQASFRTYTHSYAQLAPTENIPDKSSLTEIGVRLARQYTCDYMTSADSKLCEIVSDFDNIVHTVAREGAASIVYPTTKFLEKFKKDPLEKSYLPIIVLNIHQLAQSLDLIAHSVLTMVSSEDLDRQDKSAKEIADPSRDIETEWRHLNARRANLFGHYRFNQISDVTMHNNYNKAFKSAFELGSLEAQLSRDIADMSNTVQTEMAIRQNQRQKADAKKQRWFRRLIAAAVAAISTVDFVALVANLYPNAAQNCPSVFLLALSVIFIGVFVYLLKIQPTDT